MNDFQSYASDILKSIGESTRFRIFDEVLRDKELSVMDICACLEKEQTSVSHHLANLLKSGLLTCRVANKIHFYRIKHHDATVIVDLVKPSAKVRLAKVLADLKALPEAMDKKIPTLSDVAAEILFNHAHTNRVRIIKFLKNGERSTTEIFQGLGISKELALQHLSRMVETGILLKRLDGYSVFYQVRHPSTFKIVQIAGHLMVTETNHRQSVHPSEDPSMAA